MWLEDFVINTAHALDERGREALYARGVTDDQIALYQIGWLDRKLPELEYPKSFLDWSFQGKKLDDVFVLPLTNAVGEIKGLQFRHVEPDKKGYMDFIPTKGEAILFGLGQAMTSAWESNRILLVEGAFDLFPLQRYFPEVVATLTAHMVESLVRVFRRIGVKDLWLGYDNDKTGRDSVLQLNKQYGKEFSVHALLFPKEPMVNGKITKDPSDLWETWGEQKFGSFIRPLIERGGSFITEKSYAQRLL